MPLEHSPVKQVQGEQVQEKQVQEEQSENVPILNQSQLPPPPSGQGSRSVSSGSFHGFTWEEGVTPETMQKLRGLFRQRSHAEQKLVRIQLTLRDQRNLKLAQLQCTKEKLVAIYTEFSHFHSEIMALIPDEASDEQDEIYCSFEDRHSELSNRVQEMINYSTPREPTNYSIPQPQVIIQQQPLKAPIPTFDGNYSNWPKFKAIFQDLMAQSGDSEALKLYHLDKALIGSASGILDEKIINEGNYQQAWKVLTDRYENKRVIVESHIRGLLNLKRMSKGTFKELDNLLSEATGHVESLRFQKQELIGISEHIVVYLIVTALDDSTRMAWERTQQRGELPKYDQTIFFLKTNCQILEQCESSRALSQPTIPKTKAMSSISKMPPLKTNAATTSSSTYQASCQICGGGHFNFQCETFKQLTATQRAEKVRATGLCYNCLRKGHQSRECTSSKTCQRCSKRHHTLLHEETGRNNSQEGKTNVACPQSPRIVNQEAAIQPPVPVVDQSVSTTCSSNYVPASKTVLLLTAVVQAIDKHNRPHPCRVLLDSGSQVNFVTEEMANRLGAPKMQANVPITGINALRSLARDKVFIKFRSSYGGFQANIECLVTPKVTGIIPNVRIDFDSWKLPEGIQLADPRFFHPEKVDMLIGGELFFDILKPDHFSLGTNLPQLRDTHLGWVVAGVINEPYISNAAIQHANVASINTIEKMMQQFWNMEEVPDVSPFSPEQLSCEAHFMSTYERNETGSYWYNSCGERQQDGMIQSTKHVKKNGLFFKCRCQNFNLSRFHDVLHFLIVSLMNCMASLMHQMWLMMPFRRVVLWSDSTIVLAWLKKPLDQLQTFVRNRIAIIQTETKEHEWNYIRSANNPADIVSRGQLPEDLKQNILWWNGPHFLEECTYEVDEVEEIRENNLPELKAHVATPESSCDPFPFFLHHSSFRKIQRIMGYVLRFISNCRGIRTSNPVKQIHLTIVELRQASEAIVKVIQRLHFGDEIQRVVSKQTCKRLGNLSPVYDNGLLRVGGRLDRSKLPFASKHQLIIPDKDPVIKKMISALHVEHLHVGQTGLISVIRQRYWLLNAKSTVRQVARSCVKCFRVNPVEIKQLMGNLPSSRVVPSPPFAVTGVDYAGPFQVRQGSHRPMLMKSYVAVYVCMATKAVHLEIVSDLSTDAFLASLRRFVSRRGMVQQIHSDNATNFHGAENELHALYQQFQDQQVVKKIQQFCQVREIQWQFIPPDAPEFGGLWEAAVKATKFHLKRIVGNVKLTFEEMATILTEIEAILNSRPLFSLSSDSSDPQVITPAHYLIGRPLNAPAEPSLEDIKVNRLDAAICICN
ncbi:uncharacterized protein LOC134206142 [Armigeres subalbatus]|uniref:uncharacterized protein LOC134206142 n=1 Tax=Armigeres subalbatus TaxID=124917 RepID=UPI002ED5A712